MTTAPQPAAPTAVRSRRAARVLLLSIALVGIALGARYRLDGLLDEIPVWDEWHALRAVKDESFATIATKLAPADRSIPFTLLFEALARTTGLDELGLRAPFALAGLATLVLVPLAYRRLTGELGAALLVVALALSPLLVFYSRTARPYAPALLAALLAVAAYPAWSERGSRAALAAFAIAASLGTWALPVYSPFCFAPAGADLLLAGLRRDRSRLRRAALAIACGALPAALLLGPAIVGGGGTSLADRMGAGALSATTLLDSLRVFAGSDRTGAGALVAAAAVAAALTRLRDPGARPLAWAAGAQLAAILALLPRRLESSLVLTRYLLPVAVAVAILAAAAAAGFAARSPRRALPVAASVLAGLGLLSLSGPLCGWLAPGPSSFASRRLIERIAEPAAARAAERAPLPGAYRPIAATTGPGAILEVPFFVSVPDRLGDDQLRHRRELFVGVTAGVCSPHHTFEIPPAGRDGFALRRFVALDDLDGLARRGVRWVVVHSDAEARLPHVGENNRFYRSRRCVRALERLTGRRGHRVGGLTVFDLGPPPGAEAPRQ